MCIYSQFIVNVIIHLLIDTLATHFALVIVLLRILMSFFKKINFISNKFSLRSNRVSRGKDKGEIST